MKSQHKSLQDHRTIYFIFLSALIVCSGFFYVRMAHPNWLNHPPEWESAWLKNPTCQSPCFENIIPGKTQQKDIKMIVEGNSRIDFMEISEVIPYGPVLTLDLSNNEQCCDAHVYFDDNNTVQVIELSPEEGAIRSLNIKALLGTGLYVDDIISIYGYPEKVVSLYWDYGYTTFDLVYSKLGMIVELDDFAIRRENAKTEIQSYSSIGRIYLSTPELEALFEYLRESGANVRKTYNWMGYTTYPE